ncbi:hypothetical protein GCM10022247_25240 [Allokutzneria multivorans]|uniref:Aminoglycoside phosphotransferase domain-containing protein n=1 Tax=Allokutzneria multivorans TaxID=1142134 RepID=A0ABP7RWQ7_9PSEU
MARVAWEHLPASVRHAVERHTGSVLGARSPAAGRSSDLSTTLHTSAGLVFCKGIRQSSRGAWMHRNEVIVSPHLPGCAPRLLWTVEEDDWLLLGYEHVAGRHADFSPGSSDLPLVTDALATLHGPAPSDVQSLSERLRAVSAWARLRAAPPDDLLSWQRERLDHFVELERVAFDAVDGDALIHSDLHPLNILISSKARIIDWAWACRAAPWVDHELFALRLVIAGHEPSPDPDRTAFAVAICGLWEYRSRRSPAPHWDALLRGARLWTQKALR